MSVIRVAKGDEQDEKRKYIAEESGRANNERLL